MTDSTEKIKFQVEISRMIELLAAQIYPTPFALLRENVQNSYDAILLRRQMGQSFDAAIDVTIEPTKVSVRDNGIGMSPVDLRNHFWKAGSSSKNTDAARAAGVVGTFGIGAMANFGIAEDLVVETESAIAGTRTKCFASKSTLSVTDDCITFENQAPTGNPGTSIVATIQADKAINVSQAEHYLAEFVAFLAITVQINGKVVSGKPLDEAVPQLNRTWSVAETAVDLGDSFHADIDLTGSLNGEVRISLSQIKMGGSLLPGRMILRQGNGPLRTFRSGFGLASAGVSSVYQFGGVADFLFLQPTAGREALTTVSMQMLQRLVTRIDQYVSMKFATRPESNASNAFGNWVVQHGRYDLCGNLRVRMEPGTSISLKEVKQYSQQRPYLVYLGSDSSTIKLASEDRPMLLPAHGHPRRQCETTYFRQYCKIEELSDNPRVLKEKSFIETSSAEQALAFRLASILATDYFLEAQIKYGTISHGIPILVTSQKAPVTIALDPDGATVKVILSLFQNEYGAFGHMAKDFVRNFIFPRVADLVPSSTRQGAEAFLKSVHRTREVFEYESADLDSLTSLWNDYLEGRLSFQQATAASERISARSYQVVDQSASAPVRDVVPDVIDNNAHNGQEPQQGPLPPYQRLDMSTEKKLLTIADSEQPLKGYRCFLALTDRVHEEKGDFFMQPHRTSVVWGGQKALFIFEHHSGEFGLYYDIQMQSPINDQSGGGSFETCTIVMKNRIFIPIPAAIQATFLPSGQEKKRFEVRCDILYTESRDAVN
jgi:molecular chaperone HtpG